MRKFFSFDQPAVWMFLALGSWVVMFWGFLSARYVLIDDAVSYYDHIKFYLDSLARGVFPLWDPFWCNGAPNDFFLRRIGAYNPFYLIILLLRVFHLPHHLAYLWFLAGYYFLGAAGFYLLALRVYQDKVIAFAGFALLLFSALGTRLFDSYMMLITVPLIWFFYCLVAFSQTPTRALFLGGCLSFMLLSTTYIPFYFLMFLAVFAVCFLAIFPDRVKPLWEGYARFFGRNMALTISVFVVLILYFLPLAMFYLQSARGTIALPGRHWGDASSAHVLTVSAKALNWGVLEDILYSSYYTDLHRYKFAILYVPFVSMIFLGLGLFGRLNRRFWLIFASGFVLLCLIIPYGLPFYDFVYKHFFIMKYFRNLHFFIWFVLVPLFVLLVLESLKLWNDRKPASLLGRAGSLAYVLALHALAVLFVRWRADAIPSTYWAIGLSAFFFSVWALTLKPRPWFLFLGFTVVLAVQPFEVYRYLSQKAFLKEGAYAYDRVNWTLSFGNAKRLLKASEYPKRSAGLYYAAKTFNDLHERADPYALAVYLSYPFRLYDVPVLSQGIASAPSIPVEADSGLLKVLSFTANSVRLRTDLPGRKFLVYNDSYDPRWQVFVNGRKETLYQANGAFKGVWVPAGKAQVEFRFEASWIYVFNVFLYLGGLALLAGALYYYVRER